MTDKKRAKLAPDESAAVAKNVHALLTARGWKIPDLAGAVVGEDKPEELHNYLRQLRPRLKGQRAFRWDDLPGLAKALGVSEARLRWSGESAYHTGALRLPPGVTLGPGERRPVEDAVAQRRQFLSGGVGSRQLLSWPHKKPDERAEENLRGVPGAAWEEGLAKEFARILRTEWRAGLQPLAAPAWLFSAAGGVSLNLDRPDFEGWPGLAPFFYNADRVVIVTAGYASLPVAGQRYYWARALGWFVAVEYLTTVKPLDRFARALLLPETLRNWVSEIRRLPVELAAVAAAFGVDAETFTRRLDDWEQILNERQRLRLQRSIEKALAPTSS